MKIKPIKTKKDYKMALQQIESLFDAKPNTPRGDLLDVLSTLLEAYEEKHYSVDYPEPVDAICYWMESRGLSRKDLEKYLGSRSKVSEVLSKKRGLSLQMIQNLNKGLHIPAEILIKTQHLENKSHHRAQ
jgi:HTH-type transcriptional regulator/antitoxin HigA